LALISICSMTASANVSPSSMRSVSRETTGPVQAMDAIWLSKS
jgi:hypothetical protein